MEAIKSREQAINWLKNAQKRQQEWQLEVKKRWGKQLFSKVNLIYSTPLNTLVVSLVVLVLQF